MADDWTRIGASRNRPPRAHPAGSQGQRHPAAARHPAGHGARPARTPARAESPRLPRRACRACDARPAEDRHHRRAMAGRHPPTAVQLANREPSMWPQAAPYRVKEPETRWRRRASPVSARMTPDDGGSGALVSAPETLRNGDHDIVLPAAWPERVAITALPEARSPAGPRRSTCSATAASTRARAKKAAQNKAKYTRAANGSANTWNIAGSAKPQQMGAGNVRHVQKTLPSPAPSDRPATRSKSPGRRQASSRPLGLPPIKGMVRPRGLEPPRVAPLAPQASASTNSATAADEVKRAPYRRRVERRRPCNKSVRREQEPSGHDRFSAPRRSAAPCP